MEESYNHRTLPPGTMIQEYCLDRVVGRGSFGIVYLATNKFLPETVAIKEFLPDDLADRIEGSRVVPKSADLKFVYQEVLQKFLDEARTLFELAQPHPHRNIVRVMRYIEANGTGYMVMDYEQGESLSEKLKDPPRTLPESELIDILFPLLNGLETVHAASVTHRDIKPGNILIRPDHSPVLIDFGAARRKRPDGQKSQLPIFTPDYAAPEQYYDIGEQGPWTDIYALGATLYRAVTGEVPTKASARLRGEKYQSAVNLAGRGYSPGFLAAIDRALALQPEDRPQSISQWRALLSINNPASNTGTKTKISPISERENRPRMIKSNRGHRRPLLFTSATLILLAVIGLITFYYWPGSEPESEPVIVDKSERQLSQPVNTAAILNEVERVIRDLECAQVSPEVANNGRLLLNGYVASQKQLEYLHSQLTDIQGVTNVKDKLEVHPIPFCRVIGLLSDYQLFDSMADVPAMETMSRSKGSIKSSATQTAVFKAGQLLIVSATAALPGYLYVDYFDSAGDVIHMLPSPISASNTVSAGQRVTIGGQPCPECYEIFPPHGKNMIVAISSSVPLLGRQLRDEIEKLETYLPVLRAGFEAVRDQQGKITVTYKYITTHD